MINGFGESTCLHPIPLIMLILSKNFPFLTDNLESV
jgi:hypothetical protein